MTKWHFPFTRPTFFLPHYPKQAEKLPLWQPYYQPAIANFDIIHEKIQIISQLHGSLVSPMFERLNQLVYLKTFWALMPYLVTPWNIFTDQQEEILFCRNKDTWTLTMIPSLPVHVLYYWCYYTNPQVTWTVPISSLTNPVNSLSRQNRLMIHCQESEGEAIGKFILTSLYQYS